MISLLLASLYPLAVQVERKGFWYILAPFTFIVLIIDVIANYTELALITLDFPKQGEYTFSTRLKRLQHDKGWRGYYAAYVILYLNFFAPNGKHV